MRILLESLAGVIRPSRLKVARHPCGGRIDEPRLDRHIIMRGMMFQHHVLIQIDLAEVSQFTGLGAPWHQAGKGRDLIHSSSNRSISAVGDKILRDLAGGDLVKGPQVLVEMVRAGERLRARTTAEGTEGLGDLVLAGHVSLQHVGASKRLAAETSEGMMVFCPAVFAQCVVVLAACVTGNADDMPVTMEQKKKTSLVTIGRFDGEK